MKQWFDATLVDRLGERLQGVYAPFDRLAFASQACAGLEQLELSGRVAQIADALGTCLPADPGLEVVVRALPPISTLDNVMDQGYWLWPIGEYIARYGLSDWEGSWRAMLELTQRFTAEFAVRPFLAADAPRAVARLRALVRHESAHVRRWASEGTRTRLPWARRIPALLGLQAERLALLSELRADESLYVRRSVANHLQDIVKDDLAAGLATLTEWSRDDDPRVLWVVKHAARGLLKAGHPDVMELFGLTAGVSVESFAVEPSEVGHGSHVTLAARIACGAAVRVDFALVNPRGSRKVFRWADQAGDIMARYRFVERTTRRVVPGQHWFELICNGQVLARQSVMVYSSRE